MLSEVTLSRMGGSGSAGPYRTHSSREVTGGKPHPRVLVVDDEHHARITTARMLRYEGFEVLEADSGKEALGIIKANPDIGLAIIDIVMPEMSGTVLAHLLPEVAPQCGVIMMTGYTRDQARLGPTFSIHPVLIKPFTTNQLVQLVESVLDRLKH